MKCPFCGHGMTGVNARLCSSCGRALPPTEPGNPIEAIDAAIDAFEEDELQHASNLLRDELEHAREARDELTLIYLLDVLRQMDGQLGEGELDELGRLLAAAGDALDAVQEGALSATLVSARERFAEGDREEAGELLYRELTASEAVNAEQLPLAAWRVFAVASDMAHTLGDADAQPFEEVKLSAEMLLQSEAPDETGDEQNTEIDEVEHESVVEPFETQNPWLQKLFAMADYGRAPTVAIDLLLEVSPDPDERLLAAVKCEHGRLRRGYLLATTKALRWIRTFPTPDDDSWGYDYKLDYKGLGIAKAVLILGTGDQFQTYRTRGKPFARMYGVIQEAMAWEAEHANEMVFDAVTAPATSGLSLAEEIQKLATLHEQGLLSVEEFAAAKRKLLS